MNKNTCLQFFFYLLFILSTYSQINSNYSTDRIAKKLHELSDKWYSDVVYLQTNKDIYFTQEDLWFKGYVLDSKFFLPSLRSDIFFLQLINDKTDEPVWEETYEIEKGFVNGHIYLQDYLENGNYTLYAHTSHSFFKKSKAFYALKKIKVYTTIENKNTIENHQLTKTDSIQFAMFPEGGHLVSGLENKLAFKAMDSNGYPVEISGTLYENDSTKIAFKSIHSGMGSFIFTPDANKKYSIKLDSVSTQHPYTLPPVLKQAKTMQLVSQTKNYVFFKVTHSPYLKNEQIFLRLQVRGVVYKVASTLLKKESVIKIPLEGVSQGIAEVTLFNENLEPIAERLVYVNLEQKLYIESTLNKGAFETREKVQLKIKVTNHNQEPVVAFLGISVFDKFYKNITDTKNILTHYYLSSQLKGKLYDPAYYFDGKNKTRKSDLDLLLLTQGWRRYVWSESNLKEQEKNHDVIISDPLKGRITTSKHLQIDNKFVVISTGNENAQTEYIEVDSLNNFEIKGKHLKIGAQGYIYLKPIGKEDTNNYKIWIKSSSTDSINKYRQLQTAMYPYKEKPKSLLQEVIPFKLDSRVQNLDEILIKKKKDKIYRNNLIGTLDSLSRPPLNIDFGCVCHNGIVNCVNHCPQITERKKSYSDEELLKMFNLTPIKGFYAKREFYNMTYDEESIKEPFPDARNTLFWNPDIITNNQGEVIIEFYCSDTNTDFMGNIEGVGNNGLIGSQNFNLRVDKRLSE